MPKSKGSGNIKVCVRVRPFIPQEINGMRRQVGDPDLACCVGVSSKKSLDIWKDADPSSKRTYEFDRVYWSHSPDHELYATQEVLQAELGATLLTNAVDGFNNCIFAYGQTGSGKSYSVLGGKGQDRGLLPRIVEGLFRHVGGMDAKTTCRTCVSFLEIYNETIRDLLSPGDAQEPQRLDVKQHPVLGVIVPGLTEAPVETIKAVMDLIEYGSQMRHVGATAMNAMSSRSHCVFTFRISIKDETSGECKFSQTNLVDLAGSERAKRTKAEGARLKEGSNINQSLLTLARVISSLAEKKRTNTVPFRDSRLTYMLKESLSGNSKTVMVAAISPANWDYDETVSTLKFAQSVKLVQTAAKQNKDSEQNIERQLRVEMVKLKQQLEALEGCNSVPTTIERAQRKLDEQEELLKLYAPGGWEELLESEKRKKARRAATTQNSVSMSALKDSIAAFYKRNPRISFRTNDEGSSSADSLLQSSSEEENDFEGDFDLGDQIVIVRFPDEGQPADQSASTVAARNPARGSGRAGGSVLVIKGNSVKPLLHGDQGLERARAAGERQEQLAAQMRELGPRLAEAESLVRRLSPSSVHAVQLHAAVAVDFEVMEGSLLVHAERGPSQGDEWLSAAEFSERHAWLRGQAEQRGFLGHSQEQLGHVGDSDAWHEAALAVGSAQDTPLELKTVGMIPEAAPRVGLLRSELAEAQSQLEAAKAQLRRDEVAAAQATGQQSDEAPLLSAAAPGECEDMALRSKRLARLVQESFAEASRALDAAEAVIQGPSALLRAARAL